jgi:cytohesin
MRRRAALLVAILLALRCGTHQAASDLMTAAASNDVEGVRRALAADGHPNETDASRASPLTLAAARGYFEVVRLLVDGGARIDLRPDAFWAGRGRPPLIHAATGGHADVVAYLLGRGANPDAPDGDGKTALHYAAYNANPALFDLLVRHGAKVDAIDISGLTALGLAGSVPGEATAARIAALVRLGANVHHRDTWQKTPLHHAAEGGNPAAVRALLAAGADPEARDKYGLTPLDLARARGFEEAARLLAP